MIDVLDLDAVTGVREYGTFGLNRSWDQLDSHGPRLDLPMYGGGYVRRPSAIPAEGDPPAVHTG